MNVCLRTKQTGATRRYAPRLARAMRTLSQALFLVVASLPIAGGCTNGDASCQCATHVRDTIAFPQQTATGSITWVGTWPIVEESPPPDHQCRAFMTLPTGICRPQSGPPPMDLHVEVECTAFGRLYAGFYLTLGDVRDLPVGAYPLSVSTWGAITSLSNTTTLHVESSKGGSQNYPTVVTADFAKTLRLDFISGTFDASLRFELAADQFEATPAQSCRICGC